MVGNGDIIDNGKKKKTMDLGAQFVCVWYMNKLFQFDR